MYRLQVRSREDLTKVVKMFDKNMPIVKLGDYKRFRVSFDEWTKKSE